MKFLVATKEKQGFRKNDFCFCEEGEPVVSSMECDKDKGKPDGPCGCSRSMAGVKSTKATTTFKVVEVDFAIMLMDIAKYLVDSWAMDRTKALDVAQAELNYIAKIADGYPIGTILEKRGDTIQSR